MSVNEAGTGTPNRGSELLAITPDGRFVAFWSDASDISSETTNTLGDVYVRDVQFGVTYCITRAIRTYGSRRFRVAITPDGAYAALQELSFSGAAPGGQVFRADVFSGFVTNIATSGRPGSSLAISDDGDQIIFPGNNGLYLRQMWQSGPRLLITNAPSFQTPLNITSFLVSRDFQTLWFVMNVTNRGEQLFSYDISTDRMTSVSTNAQGGFINASVATPFSIDDSGSIAAFETAASDFAPYDFNAAPDVYLAGGRLVSIHHPTFHSETGVGYGTLPRGGLNADGTRIFFTSTDSSLVLNDTNEAQDLFVFDLTSSPRVAAIDGVQRGNSVYSAAVSADGRSAAFERFAGEDISQPVRGDFLHADLRTGQIQLRGGPNPAGSSAHWRASISQDGRWLVFQDGDRIRITDFHTPPIPGQASNTVVDVKAAGSGNANGPSSSPIISLDGEWVVFLSRASDIAAATNASGQAFSVPQVYAAKFLQQTTRMVSVTANGAPLPAGGTNAALSANARFVAFETYLGSDIYRHDLLARGSVTNILVCANCSDPSISGDGRFIVYQGHDQIYLWDAQTENAEPIGGEGSREGIITSDARFIAFSKSGQVYLHDRWNAETHLLSRGFAGPGNAPSGRPQSSHDGRTIAFQSFAANLVPRDYNNRRDIFMVSILPVDTDGDKMDDDWEQFHFTNLARNGLLDADADGHTDQQEFLAGTDPLDAASVLRLRQDKRRLVPGRLMHPELEWTSAPGKTYRIQHTPDLALPWTDASGDILTGGRNGVITPEAPGLYRIRLIE